MIVQLLFCAVIGALIAGDQLKIKYQVQLADSVLFTCSKGQKGSLVKTRGFFTPRAFKGQITKRYDLQGTTNRIESDATCQ